MIALDEALTEYVTVRRALGTRLVEPANTLRQSVRFLEGEGASHITTALACRYRHERRCCPQPRSIALGASPASSPPLRCWQLWAEFLDQDKGHVQPRLLPLPQMLAVISRRLPTNHVRRWTV